MDSAPWRPLTSRILALSAILVGNLFVAVHLATDESSSEWHELLSNKVYVCGAAAVVLLVISLLLRGFLKLISLAIVLLLVAGAYWFFRDAPERHGELLPQEWTVLAGKTLRLPKSQEAWRAV